MTQEEQEAMIASLKSASRSTAFEAWLGAVRGPASGGGSPPAPRGGAAGAAAPPPGGAAAGAGAGAGCERERGVGIGEGGRAAVRHARHAATSWGRRAASERANNRSEIRANQVPLPALLTLPNGTASPPSYPPSHLGGLLDCRGLGRRSCHGGFGRRGSRGRSGGRRLRSRDWGAHRRRRLDNFRRRRHRCRRGHRFGDRFGDRSRFG